MTILPVSLSYRVILCNAGLIFLVFNVSSWTTKQLNELSAKVTEISIKCALCVFRVFNSGRLGVIRPKISSRTPKF